MSKTTTWAFCQTSSSRKLFSTPLSPSRVAGREPRVAASHRGLHLFRALHDFLDRAAHIEGLLGNLVELAINQHLEALDGFFDLDVAALEPRELLGHEERLTQEALDLARPRHRQLVLFAQLLDAQDGDDVLEVLVALENRFHRAGH